MAFCISRYKNISVKEFALEVVTPMFLGGANLNDAELRIPSLKGVLRFWWRATCGIESLEEMQKEEAEIFGSTENKARLSIQIDESGTAKPVLKNLPKGRLGIIDYLSYGISKKGYLRAHIPAGSTFKLKFFFYDKNQPESLLNAFYAFINYGGMGAKSRNGFGSLYVKNEKVPVLNSNAAMKKYTSLSNQSILFNHFNVYPKWEDALSEIGAAYRTARLSLKIKKRLLIARPIVQAGNRDERHAKPYFLHVSKLDNGKFQGQILFMPYNYHMAEKRGEYMEVCKKMNAKLKESAGGTK